MHLSEDVAQYLYGQPKLKRFGEKRNPLRNLQRTSELVTSETHPWPLLSTLQQ